MSTSPKNAVLLIGSPRLEHSTSKALGDRLLERLATRGMATESHFIHRAFETTAKAGAMLAAVDGADIVIFAFPLYVDHLPAPVIWACGKIAAWRRAQRSTARPLLACVVQCGFPETHQNQPAVDIMHRFADSAGFEWAGGLIMGMGGAAAGRPIPEKPKGMLRNMIKGLDQAAADLAEGRAISIETIALMGRKLFPYKLYYWIANYGLRREIRKYAKKSGKALDAYARPYVSA